MKPNRWCPAIMLIVSLWACLCVWSQEKSQEEPEEKSQQQPQEKRPTLGPEPADQNRPTLGGEPGPSLNGPRTSTITDARKLLRVHTVFVETMDNGLSGKLAEDLSKSGPFRVVANRNEADAVLRGTCFDSRRLRHVHSEVFLADRHGASIWQDIIRQPYNPPPLAKAVGDTALIVVSHLTDSIREAQRR